jgi:hypothetical protein
MVRIGAGVAVATGERAVCPRRLEVLRRQSRQQQPRNGGPRITFGVGVVGLVVVLAGVLAAAGCSSGPAAGQTGTPTQKATPEATSSPTSDPIAQALKAADDLRVSGSDTAATAQYASILQQFTDPTVRAAAFHGLEEIGARDLQQGDLLNKKSSSHEDGFPVCATYLKAQSAYRVILGAQDRPAFAQDKFYTSSARVDVAMISCHLWYETPEKTYTEVIKILLDDLALYPDEPAVMDLLVPAILSTYQGEASREYETKSQDVVNNAALITAKVGDYKVGGKTVSTTISTSLLAKDLCSGKPVTSSTVGTSSPKRLYSCGSSDVVDQAGLAAADPSQIWYVLDSSSDSAADVQCTGYRTDAGKDFFYSYPGRSKEIYSLRDVHTGKVVASKTFQGTAPRCVFTSCSLNTFTNTATCTGGEGHSTYDEAELITWLKANVK